MDETEDKIAHALQMAVYSMIYINDIACACVIEMEDKVKAQDKETQKIFGALVKRQRRYEMLLADILSDQIDFCADFNLIMDDVIKDKVASLYYEINNYLKENGIENHEFIAHAELAYTMAEYSVLSIEKRIKALQNNKMVMLLRSYELKEMATIAKNLCGWVEYRCKGVNLNDSEKIKKAFHSLDEALCDTKIIEDAISKADLLYEMS